MVYRTDARSSRRRVSVHSDVSAIKAIICCASVARGTSLVAGDAGHRSQS